MEISEREYERLMRIAEKDHKYCEGYDCAFQKWYMNKKWSWSQFFIGIIKFLTSPELWIFAVVILLFIHYANKLSLGAWIAYVSLGGAFMFFKPLSNLIYNGKLNLDANLGATIGTNITKNVNEKIGEKLP